MMMPKVIEDYCDENPEDEEDMLKLLYQKLELRRLNLISIDARNPDHKSLQPTKPPYGGALQKLEGLNKETTFIELKEKVSLKMRWPSDEIRLWDQVQYENYMECAYNAFCADEYRSHVPTFLDLCDDELVYPLLLDDHFLVVERVPPLRLSFPASVLPLRFTFGEWWGSLPADWRGVTPAVNRTVYRCVEVVKMEQNKCKNSLFNALGYLLHNTSGMKGETSDEETAQKRLEKGGKEDVVRPCRYRAAALRKELAGFVVDYEEEINASGILKGAGREDLDETNKIFIESVDSYIETLLDLNYCGGDIDITFAAIMSGSEVQIFDVAQQEMKMYGKGHVERFGNPDRLGPKFSIKAVRWADGTYDPICFVMEPGMEPDRREQPFCMAYVVLAFDWMAKQPASAVHFKRMCGSCAKEETEPGRHFVCGDCRLVAYCGRECQIQHWRKIHKMICKRQDFEGQSAACCEVERRLRDEVSSELEKRRNRQVGVRKLKRIDGELRLEIEMAGDMKGEGALPTDFGQEGRNKLDKVDDI